MAKTQIKKGDIVTAIFAWREDEHPTEKNFFTGKVKNVIRKRSGAVYFELEKLANPVPEDRVSLAA